MTVLEVIPDELYTVADAAALFKVSARTVWGMLKAGKMRSVKVGGNRRILGSELLRVIGMERTEPTERETPSQFRKRAEADARACLTI